MQVTGYFDSEDGLITFGFAALNESHAARELHNQFGDMALGADLFAEAAGEASNSKRFRDHYDSIASLAQ